MNAYEPREMPFGKAGSKWAWMRAVQAQGREPGSPNQPCFLPPDVYAKLTGEPSKADVFKLYPTREAALADLDNAVK